MSYNAINKLIYSNLGKAQSVKNDWKVSDEMLTTIDGEHYFLEVSYCEVLGKVPIQDTTEL
jgi:hypothetical protein